MGNWLISTAATEHPITVSEAKEWLRVENSEDDTLIGVIIGACTATAENYLSQAFCEKEVEEVFDSWFDNSGNSALKLTIHPVNSITSITYLDNEGTEQTLSTDTYIFDNYAKRAAIYPTHGESWPSFLAQKNTIKVTYTAGYGEAADVPDDIKLALRLMIADAYENRTDSVRQLPTASKYLLDRTNYTALF